MLILGINAVRGDASASPLGDGELGCAVAEDRLNRWKHGPRVRSLTAQYGLKEAGSRGGVEAVREPRAVERVPG